MTHKLTGQDLPDADAPRFWGWDGTGVFPNPVLSPAHLGVQVGDGIFETLELISGVPFALDRHLSRLALSAERVGLDLPARPVLDAVVKHAVQQAPSSHRRLRITVSSTGNQLAPVRCAQAAALLVVATGPGHAAKANARVVTVPWVRNERGRLAGVKSTSYQENLLISTHARAEGADEALVANTVGDLCEGTSSNVLVDLGGQIYTPALETGCLAGVTRELILEWGAQAGVKIIQAQTGELPYRLLTDPGLRSQIHGLALTGTLRGLQPITRVDDWSAPQSANLTQLGEIYRSRLTMSLNP